MRGGVLVILWQQRWLVGLLAAIAVGAAFRFIWLHDVEYKGDEVWTFLQVKEFWHSHTLLPVGMPSSAGLPNAGMSLWAFLALSAFVPNIHPLELTRAVQWLNVITIWLLAVFVRKCVPCDEREPWLWSVALISVNPLAVLFSRKLWPPDILAPFTLVMLVGWWYRHRWWGAFLWGLLGTILGQIQLTGFLFSAAFLSCILLFHRHSVHWPAWVSGTILGLLPLVPWLVALAKGGLSVKSAQIQNFITPFRDWVSLSLGIDIHYSLGNSFLSFLAYPKIGAQPIYLAAVLLSVIVLIFLILLARLVMQLHADSTRTLEFLFGARSSTVLALNAAFFGYSLLLLAMLRPIHLHYFTVAFSLPALWLAWIARAGSTTHTGSLANSRRLLAALVLVQAGVTLVFLAYIHEVQIIDGDYGTAYGSQVHPDGTLKKQSR